MSMTMGKIMIMEMKGIIMKLEVVGIIMVLEMMEKTMTMKMVGMMGQMGISSDVSPWGLRR